MLALSLPRLPPLPPGLHYQIAPRANIFRRDQAAISSLEHMREMMRNNDYRTDPVSCRLHEANTTVY